MSLEKINVKKDDYVFIRQGDLENGKGVGSLNNDGYLYLFDEDNTVAYKLPDEYKNTPIILYHPCGGYQDGLIMVSLLGEIDLQYHHDFADTAGMWGWIDVEGNVVIEPQFIFAMSMYNGRAIVCRGKWEIDANGRYDSEEESWGVIDKSGKEIIPCKYNEITEVDGADNLYLCHYGDWDKDSHFVIIDVSTGKQILEAAFDYDSTYMFNECYFQDDKIVFDEHVPGEGINYLSIFEIDNNKWLYFREEYNVTDGNGNKRIVANKDGYEIIVF